VTKEIWDDRFQDIRAFERYLHRNGRSSAKFFLHVSRKEQRRRFLERPRQSGQELEVLCQRREGARFWHDYMKAYEETIRATATEHSPWYVVPADNKWFTRTVVAAAVIDTLSRSSLQYPKVSAAKKKELAASRAALLSEK